MPYVQLQKPKQKTLTKEFVLENPNISVQQSVEFMRKLTAVAVSTISYLRNVFPSSAFSTKKLNGTKIWLLKGSDDIPGTHTLISWIKDAFEAVRAHILKKMILVLEQPDEGITLEVYSFNFSYNFEEISCQLLSEKTGHQLLVKSKNVPENMKRAIQQLLRSVLVLVQGLKPLPTNCELSMRLEFNENVPVDFELPKFFTVVDSLDINFPPEAHTIKLGKVESKFTAIALSTKTILNKEDETENETEEDQLVQSSQPEVKTTTCFMDNDIRNTSQLLPAEARTLTENMSLVSLIEKEISCICECNNELSAVIKCCSCRTYQHKACYKLSDDQERPQHICVNCHEPNSSDKACTDVELIGNKNRKFEALYRRALVHCLTTVRVSSKTFTDLLELPKQMALKIFNKLENDGFLRPGKSPSRSVKTEHLRENAFNNYFGPSSVAQLELMDTDENALVRSSNDIEIISLKRTQNLDDDYPMGQQKRFKYASNQRQYNIQPCP
uniref:HORMA domain-containing protein n=1 Tax=Graphocephala atropunctata TaxID=36148 RepID=A0A1B6L3N7_9HEMI